MAKTITLNYKGNEYILEYNLRSLDSLANAGVERELIVKQPERMLPKLFEGAFLVHHKGISKDLVNELYSMIPDKTGFLEKLIEMYNEPLEALLSEPDESEKGNLTWDAKW